MSGKFEHGQAEYKGFRIETSGAKKGKIVDTGWWLRPRSVDHKNILALFFGFA